MDWAVRFVPCGDRMQSQKAASSLEHREKDGGARSSEVGVEENRYLNMTTVFVCSKQWGATDNRNNVAWNCGARHCLAANTQALHWKRLIIAITRA